MKVNKYTIPLGNDALCAKYLEAIYAKFPDAKIRNIHFTYGAVASKLDVIVESNSFKDVDFEFGQSIDKLPNKAKFVSNKIVLDE